MNREISHHASSPARVMFDSDEGFVSESSTYMIFDDLDVIPDNYENSICLPLDIDVSYTDFDSIKLETVNVTHKEILDLLKCSLFSATPLTDVFLMKERFHENEQADYELDCEDLDNDDLVDANSGGKIIKVKVMIRKSNNKILFALGGEDFADFILSFLTFPLGRVMDMLSGNSNMVGIDNLYNSLLDLDPNKYWSFPGSIDQLVKSPLAHQFKLQNQILSIYEMYGFFYSCFSKNIEGKLSGYLTAPKCYEKHNDQICAPLSYLEPQSSIGEAYSNCGGRGFTKGSSMYMVTDDLVVTPGSSISAISFLTKLKIPPSDLESKVITIGIKEGLSLVKASLTSSSALSDGLAPFLKAKNENIQN